MSYRPPGWKNYSEKLAPEHPELKCELQDGMICLDWYKEGVDDAFEAGADAMLEALRKYNEATECVITIKCIEELAGRPATLVFIPDENKEG